MTLIVAPARLFESPKEATPTSVNGSVPVANWICTGSPTASPADCAVATSTTTSPVPVGARPSPSEIVNGLSSGSSIHV